MGDSGGMSDTSQGHGWWLASDGKWYPPEAWTGPPPQTGQAPHTATENPAGYQSAGYPPRGTPRGAQRRTNGLAIASLACACAGIIPFLFGIPAVPGIIFGFVARGQIRDASGTQDGAGLALAGIIVGFSLIALFILAIILVAIFDPSSQPAAAPAL
jgi:hypothetical protein